MRSYSKELGDAPLPQNVEVCLMEQAQEKEGVYGIGMKINRENPHVVQLVFPTPHPTQPP
jgi:hypothetical protein